MAVRGRRQVGKSRLVEHFCQTSGLPYAFFQADQGSSPAQSMMDLFEAVRGSRSFRNIATAAGSDPSTPVSSGALTPILNRLTEKGAVAADEPGETGLAVVSLSGIAPGVHADLVWGPDDLLEAWSLPAAGEPRTA